VEEARRAFEEASCAEKPMLIDVKTDFRYNAPGMKLYTFGQGIEIVKGWC